jgi:CBS domain containing-hemolysin-like protein
LIQCVITAVIATLLTWWLGHYRLGLFLYFVSAIIAVCGFLLPKAFAALERTGQKLAHVVGVILTWLLLMPFFYLCFAPARLILKLSGKDPMARRYKRDCPSYWEDHKPPTASQSYTRQY